MGDRTDVAILLLLQRGARLKAPIIDKIRPITCEQLRNTRVLRFLTDVCLQSPANMYANMRYFVRLYSQ